jgi:hypothetical protein
VRERGSALMLMPAAVLVLAILGAIAVDSAMVFLAQRELVDAASGAANDAAGAALEDAAFYRGGGRLAIDQQRALQVAEAGVAARAPAGLTVLGRPTVRVDGGQVCVELRASVRRIFARALPGFGDDVVVTARATATAAGGSAGPDVPARALC